MRTTHAHEDESEEANFIHRIYMGNSEFSFFLLLSILLLLNLVENELKNQ